MSRNRHGEGVDDFRQALAELIRMNDERGRKHPDSNAASRPLHPQSQPVNKTRYTKQNRPTMPAHVARLPHPAAPPPQYRHPASRAPMPTRPSLDRKEVFRRRMSSAMAQHSHDSTDDNGMMGQTGLFAGALLVACCATFALVYYLGTDDRVTASSSHFRAPATAQATLGGSNPEDASNTTINNQAIAADAKALSDIASGSWVVQPSDVNQRIPTEGATSVGQQTAGVEPSGSTATRQQLFESFQTYLQETGLAPASNSPHQEALFNSFVRWNVEVANAE